MPGELIIPPDACLIAEGRSTLPANVRPVLGTSKDDSLAVFEGSLEEMVNDYKTVVLP